MLDTADTAPLPPIPHDQRADGVGPEKTPTAPTAPTVSPTEEREKPPWLAIAIGAVAIAMIVLAIVVGTRDPSGDETDEVATETTAPEQRPAAPPASPSVPDSPAFPSDSSVPEGAIRGDTPCPPKDGSAERITSFEEAPPMCLAAGIDYEAIIKTDVGEIRVELDRDSAPLTVNNFVTLARYRYYDGVAFHRVIPGFMLQGGDAVGDPPGTGGPGYQVADELPPAVSDYVEGSLAMANSGPDTNGSQFFIWLGPSPLPAPDYSLFGQVVEGLDVAKAIEADGSPTGTPIVPHRVETVEIVEQVS